MPYGCRDTTLRCKVARHPYRIFMNRSSYSVYVKDTAATEQSMFDLVDESISTHSFM